MIQAVNQYYVIWYELLSTVNDAVFIFGLTCLIQALVMRDMFNQLRDERTPAFIATNPLAHRRILSIDRQIEFTYTNSILILSPASVSVLM
jgi:hypothetical protein